jgi:glycosyltransferase involved in cell wall biosynthesis
LPLRYNIGVYGVPVSDTGVGGHIENISKRLSGSFKVEIASNRLLRRREVWAFEPVPTLLFATRRGKHHIIHSHNEVGLLQEMKDHVSTVTTVHLHPQRVIDEYLKEVSLKHLSLNPFSLSKLLINRAQWDRMLKVSDRIIVTCRAHIQQLSSLHNISLGKFQYIPNGVDVGVFSPKSGEKKNQAIFVGDWSWRKGAHYALEAFKLALKEIPDLKLVVVASRFPSELLESDKQLAGAIRVYQHINTSQLIQLYRSSSFLLLPSLAEASPLVMFESMACGTAVIAFDVDGIPEVITHGADGFLVPARNVEMLARSILKLAGDSCFARLMGERARETSLKYDWTTIANATARVYDELLGKISHFN